MGKARGCTRDLEWRNNFNVDGRKDFAYCSVLNLAHLADLVSPQREGEIPRVSDSRTKKNKKIITVLWQSCGSRKFVG